MLFLLRPSLLYVFALKPAVPINRRNAKNGIGFGACLGLAHGFLGYMFGVNPWLALMRGPGTGLGLELKRLSAQFKSGLGNQAPFRNFNIFLRNPH